MGGGIARGAKGFEMAGKDGRLVVAGEARFKFGFGRFVRVVGGGFEGIKNRPPREMDLLKTSRCS